jgi:hypothetical protein
MTKNKRRTSLGYRRKKKDRRTPTDSESTNQQLPSDIRGILTERKMQLARQYRLRNRLLEAWDDRSKRLAARRQRVRRMAVQQRQFLSPTKGSQAGHRVAASVTDLGQYEKCRRREEYTKKTLKEVRTSTH